jgi:hypothetical protein
MKDARAAMAAEHATDVYVKPHLGPTERPLQRHPRSESRSHRAQWDGHRTEDHGHPSKERGLARDWPCCPRDGRAGRTQRREKGCAFLPPSDEGRPRSGAWAWSSLAGPRLSEGQPRRSHAETRRMTPMVILRRRGTHALRGTRVAVPPRGALLRATMALVPRRASFFGAIRAWMPGATAVSCSVRTAARQAGEKRSEIDGPVGRVRSEVGDRVPDVTEIQTRIP